MSQSVADLDRTRLNAQSELTDTMVCGLSLHSLFPPLFLFFFPPSSLSCFLFLLEHFFLFFHFVPFSFSFFVFSSLSLLPPLHRSLPDVFSFVLSRKAVFDNFTFHFPPPFVFAYFAIHRSILQAQLQKEIERLEEAHRRDVLTLKEEFSQREAALSQARWVEERV